MTTVYLGLFSTIGQSISIDAILLDKSDASGDLRVMQTEGTRAFIGGYCFKLFGDIGQVVNLFLKNIFRIETVDRSHQINVE